MQWKGFLYPAGKNDRIIQFVQMLLLYLNKMFILNAL